MKKAKQPKKYWKETHREAVARITEENRTYLERLEKKEPIAEQQNDAHRSGPNDVRFECRYCGQALAVDISGAGQIVPCPSCRKEILVPSRPPLPHSGKAIGQRVIDAIDMANKVCSTSPAPANYSVPPGTRKQSSSPNQAVPPPVPITAKKYSDSMLKYVVSFDCAHCREALLVDESLQGQTMRCPCCSQDIFIPYKTATAYSPILLKGRTLFGGNWQVAKEAETIPTKGSHQNAQSSLTRSSTRQLVSPSEPGKPSAQTSFSNSAKNFLGGIFFLCVGAALLYGSYFEYNRYASSNALAEKLEWEMVKTGDYAGANYYRGSKTGAPWMKVTLLALGGAFMVCASIGAFIGGSGSESSQNQKKR